MAFRRRSILALAVGAATLLGLPGAAPAAPRAPVITKIRCIPAGTPACAAGISVTVGRKLQFSGRRLTSGMRVTFRWPSGALATKLRKDRNGYTARVPAGTRPGSVSVTVTGRGGRRSKPVRIRILGSGPAPVSAPHVIGLPASFAGHGMWIWELSKTEKGDVQRIADRARAANLQAVFIKGADGGSIWRQFTPELVQALKAAGLKVCAWQFVYGTNPEAEAQAALAAIARGADCFVIDAEGQYEGKYAAAQKYLQVLRAGVGQDYPVALTSFPYTDYHPRLPYSVFLGPGGAQVNAPQVYWKDIGGTVDAVSARSFAHNRIYGAPLVPLGQTYQNPGDEELQRFRQVWGAYGAGGLSWWDWQETSDAEFLTLGAPAPPATTLADPGWPALGNGSKGDQVVWLQQHLHSAEAPLAVTGIFDAATIAAVRQLQGTRGYSQTGSMDPVTWQAALSLPVTPVDWTTRKPPGASAASARAAGVHRTDIPTVGAGGTDR
jgi:peptidoglycan hydrolase-like protein with peptidoglycan-binding domain